MAQEPPANRHPGRALVDRDGGCCGHSPRELHQPRHQCGRPRTADRGRPAHREPHANGPHGRRNLLLLVCDRARERPDPDSRGGCRRRSAHIRIWRSDYSALDGRPIWEATASFDDGIELAGTAKLPTHHIDPNIDAERAFIINSLGYPDDFVALTGPQMGHNGSGDEFFTDGRAELVSLH
ncbi:LssY C-terminal domain-containing protein [Sinomonas gamaensis]|uniref:LssY C-terminal domain-containing protein n=1 Tax=Sinomonas gamaensis TaxID=2565624 RepID=UPI0011094C5A